jgi:hypothetical protein
VFVSVPCTSFYTSLVDLKASLPYLTLTLYTSGTRGTCSILRHQPSPSISVRIGSTRLIGIWHFASVVVTQGSVAFLFSSPCAFPALLSLIHLQVLFGFRSVFVVSISIPTSSCCLRRRFVSPPCCAEGSLVD